MTEPPQTTPALTNGAFVGFASRVAQKSAAWAADTALNCIIDPLDEPMRTEAMARYLREMRHLLDYMERQAQP